MARRALFAGAVLAAFAAPAGAAAPVTMTVTPAPAKLTLENAAPLAVPPRPNLGSPKPVTAPPRFITPKPFEAPPLPNLVEGPAQPAPRNVAVAPPATTPVPPPSSATPATSAPANGASKPATPTPSVAPPPTRTETAALPPPPAVAPPAAPTTPLSVLSLVFDGPATNLPDAAEATVDVIAQRLRASETARLQLRSYAAGTSETAREARQLSLARALSLRERLTAFGVRSSRIDVRAMGIDTGGSPDRPDRIDVEFLNE